MSLEWVLAGSRGLLELLGSLKTKVGIGGELPACSVSLYCILGNNEIGKERVVKAERL